MSDRQFAVGTDIGGTFTDMVVIDGDTASACSSRPPRPRIAVSA